MKMAGLLYRIQTVTRANISQEKQSPQVRKESLAAGNSSSGKEGSG